MPDATPLRPISHWRSEKPAMVSALVLKTQPFRQFDRLAGVGEGKGCLACNQRADAFDPGPVW